MLQIVKSEPEDPVVPLELVKEENKVTVLRSPQPQAGRRRGTVEVLVPTRRQLYGNNPPAFENASIYIEKYLRKTIVKKEEEKSAIFLPIRKVEIKKEEMLSEDVVSRRLALVPAYDVDLDPAIRDATTTREFTSKQWGGNTQETFPRIRPEMIAKHGLDDFMYLNLFLNPHAPQWPGAPGLFFKSSATPNARAWPTIERVLIRLKTKCWLYVGQYQCAPALSLTPDEWKSQASKVKQTWTTKISTQGWGIAIRAKIVLRKRLGREPTDQELTDACNSGEKFHANPVEVHQALDEGRAFIRSWSMKCVGYDENFQREIAAGNVAH